MRFSGLFTMFFVIRASTSTLRRSPWRAPGGGYRGDALCRQVCGARVGGIIGHAPPKVGENIGLALMPQAGVSLGLVLIAASSFPRWRIPW
jgi:hypothetical protein